MSTAQNEQGGAKVHVPPPLVFLGFILGGVAMQHFVTPIHIDIGAPLRLAIGGLIGLGGIALFASSLRWFRRTGQHPRPWTPSPSLIIEGPYRFTRNPIYVAMTVVQAAIGVGLDNLWIVCFSVPGLIVIHYIAVRPEEAYLAEKFGAPYEKYRSAVRRYL